MFYCLCIIVSNNKSIEKFGFKESGQLTCLMKHIFLLSEQSGAAQKKTHNVHTMWKPCQQALKVDVLQWVRWRWGRHKCYCFCSFYWRWKVRHTFHRSFLTDLNASQYLQSTSCSLSNARATSIVHVRNSCFFKKTEKYRNKNVQHTLDVYNIILLFFT